MKAAQQVIWTDTRNGVRKATWRFRLEPPYLIATDGIGVEYEVIEIHEGFYLRVCHDRQLLGPFARKGQKFYDAIKRAGETLAKIRKENQKVV